MLSQDMKDIAVELDEMCACGAALDLSSQRKLAALLLRWSCQAKVLERGYSPVRTSARKSFCPVVVGGTDIHRPAKSHRPKGL